MKKTRNKSNSNMPIALGLPPPSAYSMIAEYEKMAKMLLSNPVFNPDASNDKRKKTREKTKKEKNGSHSV